MTELEKLIAYEELRLSKARYCRTIDTKDWLGLSELMTEDIYVDVSDTTGVPVIVGRANAIAFIREMVANTRTAHQVYSPEIELDDGTAVAVWPMQDRVLFDDGTALTGYGHYHERWVHLDGKWKLVKLTLTRLFVEFAPTPPTVLESNLARHWGPSRHQDST